MYLVIGIMKMVSIKSTLISCIIVSTRYIELISANHIVSSCICYNTHIVTYVLDGDVEVRASE